MLYLVLFLGLLVALKLTWEWTQFQRRARQVAVACPTVHISPRPRRQVRYDDTPIFGPKAAGD